MRVLDVLVDGLLNIYQSNPHVQIEVNGVSVG